MEHYRQAIIRYCQYQERCHQEVRQKLFTLGCDETTTEALITMLITSGLLHEERFARAYARGKFNLTHWGRNKIIQQLRQRKISDYCIRKAMEEIDPEQYKQVLCRLAARKWQQQKTGMKRQREQAVFRYLVQKGFEPDLVRTILFSDESNNLA